MRTRLASFTPLPVAWPHPLGAIVENISVMERPVFDEDAWKKMFNMRQSEETEVLGTKNWLCVESDSQPPHDEGAVLNRLAASLRSAMLGFQIWCPKGWSGIIINTVSTNDAPAKVMSVSLPEPYATLRWANLLRIDGLSTVELGAIIAATMPAAKSESVAVCNPFHYLEIGLQTAVNHVKAGALLWMIGLDSLLAAQQMERFAARLSRLIGSDTRVFPTDYAGRRPLYTVGEVAADIYQLRNQIAHGDRNRKEYLAKSEFPFQPKELQFLRIGMCSYQSVLCEAALFALCASLRTVILAGRMDLVRDQRAWKKWLDSKESKGQC